eukprot:361944-Chlamydomonas_euryale.AAC.7
MASLDPLKSSFEYFTRVCLAAGSGYACRRLSPCDIPNPQTQTCRLVLHMSVTGCRLQAFVALLADALGPQTSAAAGRSVWAARGGVDELVRDSTPVHTQRCRARVSSLSQAIPHVVLVLQPCLPARTSSPALPCCTEPCWCNDFDKFPPQHFPSCPILRTSHSAPAVASRTTA